MNQSLIEKVRKGEAAIEVFENDKVNDLNGVVSEIKRLPFDLKLKGEDQYYYLNKGVWTCNNTLPPGMEAIPLKDFFEDESMPTNEDISNLVDKVVSPAFLVEAYQEIRNKEVNEEEVKENKVISNEDKIRISEMWDAVNDIPENDPAKETAIEQAKEVERKMRATPISSNVREDEKKWTDAVAFADFIRDFYVPTEDNKYWMRNANGMKRGDIPDCTMYTTEELYNKFQSLQNKKT